jgi:signal transduction histidine kinase
LARFALTSLAVTVALGGVGAFVIRLEAETAAVDEARTVTRVLAQSVITPNLTEVLVDGDPQAISRMDSVVVGRVTAGSLIRVKLWTLDGRIVYSDEHRLIGAVFRLSPDDLEAVRDNSVAAELSDLSAPENRFEQGQGRLLQVYLPVQTPAGRTLLFETYSRYSSVLADAERIWRQSLPIAFGALLLLQLLRLPLAWSSVRRLDRFLAEREQLLRRAEEAADTERRRIAGVVHDGVVQDLTVASSALVNARALAAAQGHIKEAETLALAEQSLWRGIRSLRTLLARIYPPSLHIVGLPAALHDLLDPVASQGFRVRMELPDTVACTDQTAELLFRVAKEAVRNAVHHSAASTIELRLQATQTSVTLAVVDDGIGFEVARLADTPAGGRLGLLLLRDLVTTAGGSLQIDSEPTRGTRVQVAIPTASRTVGSQR